MAFFFQTGSFRSARLCLVVLAVLVLLASVKSARVAAGEATAAAPVALNLEELNEQLQECHVVQALGQYKKQLLRGDGSDESLEETSSLTARIFAVLFPGSPAVNAILATLYISGPPNFLLALCPTNIDPSSLSVMVAFAVGGLLGDTLFHLLPEIFVGEDDERADRARLVLVEPNRNLLLGVAIMVGFLTFVAMDKGLRIATGGSGDGDHGHGHSHSHTHDHGKTATAVTTATETATRSAKSRKNGAASQKTEETEIASTAEINPSVKLSGYLNLIADFTHNITDGLAMSASFYASPTIGATTTVAVFFHEIPHEVGDFALLVQSGFSKRAAMGAQFVTAVGAMLGTVIGILVQELGSASSAPEGAAAATAAALHGRGGLLCTSLSWGDMLLPFTAGTFLYVGTVAVIPELLETDLGKAGSSSTKLSEVRKTLTQFAAIAAGAGIMLYISWQ